MRDIGSLKPGDDFNPFGLFIGSFIPNSLMRFTGISSSAKLLWSRLAQFSGRNGACYPAQKTLAEETGIGERQIRRLIRELETNGFIRVDRPKGRDRMNHLNCKYFFLWHDVFYESCRSVADSDVRSEQGAAVRSYTSKRIIKKEIHAAVDEGQKGTYEQLSSTFTN